MMSLENVTYMLMVHPGWSLGPSFMTDLQYRHRVNIKIVTDGMDPPVIVIEITLSVIYRVLNYNSDKIIL